MATAPILRCNCRVDRKKKSEVTGLFYHVGYIVEIPQLDSLPCWGTNSVLYATFRGSFGKILLSITQLCIVDNVWGINLPTVIIWSEPSSST